MDISSDRLKTLRAEKRLHQKEVADAIGISLGAYQRYEYGSISPREDKQIVIAQFFNVSLEYLRGETDERGDGFEIHAHRDPTVSGMDLDQALGIVDQLEKLSRLHDDGKLTDEEFTKLKKKIIG